MQLLDAAQVVRRSYLATKPWQLVIQWFPKKKPKPQSQKRPTSHRTFCRTVSSFKHHLYVYRSCADPTSNLLTCRGSDYGIGERINGCAGVLGAVCGTSAINFRFGVVELKFASVPSLVEYKSVCVRGIFSDVMAAMTCKSLVPSSVSGSRGFAVLHSLLSSSTLLSGSVVYANQCRENSTSLLDSMPTTIGSDIDNCVGWAVCGKPNVEFVIKNGQLAITNSSLLAIGIVVWAINVRVGGAGRGWDGLDVMIAKRFDLQIVS
jgi:hypothetical protein